MKKVLYIASLPDRDIQLKRTVESLVNQVDEIIISLNNYKYIPKFKSHKVKCHLTDNKFGDAERYRYILPERHYAFFADDDLIFPEDYIQICLNYLISFENCIFSFHGSNLTFDSRGKINHYYKNREVFRCLGDVNNNSIVDIIGTGVAFWDTGVFDFNYNKVTEKNMADVLVSIEASNQNLTRIVCSHKKDCFKYQEVPNTIHSQSYNNCSIQTSKINNEYVRYN